MSSSIISVVIPHLNQPEPLRRCLASLAQQSFDLDRAEILVVDNGSKELPSRICCDFKGVRLLQEPSPGPGPARNLGVSQSCGKLLAFIDADCTADPGWLAAIEARLDDAAGHANVIGGDVRIARRDPQRPTMLEAYESIYAYRQEEYITRHGFSGTGNLAMRREVFDAVGPFAGIELAEDRDWGRRATRMGFTIHYLPEMIVYHPARQSIDELRRKWDRHVSHDFEEARGFIGRLRWLGRSLAIACSPLVEARRILTSRRVSTGRERALAARALLGIRLYRSRRMLGALVMGTNAQSSRAWNRG